MDINKMKILFMVEKYGSFAKIAEKLSYTPSAVLHIASALEKELGVQLFVRSNRGVALSGDAKRLYNHFAELFKAHEELYSAASDIAKKHTLELKIITYSTIATHLLPEVLQGFKSEYPKVKFSIVVKNDDYEASEASDGSDILFLDHCPQNAAKWIPVMEDEYVAVVPEKEFPDTESISKNEMYEHPYIRVDDTIIDEYFTYSYFRDIISLKSAENNSAVSMVKKRIGIAVMPGIMMKRCPDGVRTLRLEPKLSRTIGIAYNPQKASWAAERFVQYVKSPGIAETLQQGI